MQIGKLLRTIIVEPLELPVEPPTREPEPEPIQSPEPASHAVSIPDSISPIVGYRGWTWDTMGLKSLCGERWHPNQSLAARCRASAVVGTIAGRVEGHDSHEAPQAKCTCGVYAAKSLEHLRKKGYDRCGIYGEVCLWGTVVEHERGWRAQLAYPENLFLSPDALPFTLAEISPRLQALTLYGSDIFVLDNDQARSLWGKRSGFDPAGLDCLIERLPSRQSVSTAHFRNVLRLQETSLQRNPQPHQAAF
ncbi:MAG: hypothetical protein WBF04_23765 [Candidatus Sulfotelmatobacter sp.]